MVSKRLFGEEEGEENGSLVPGPKRPRIWINAMREVMGAQCMQRHLSKIEPFLRKVVQEEVHNALCRFVLPTSRMPVNRIQGAVDRCYRLQFESKFPQTLFTGSKIEAEGRGPVRVVIVDTITNDIIKPGPLSSLKIDVLVIDGDFGCDGQEEWTEEEFSESIVREREGKRPLLTGELTITLSDGAGFLGEATFTDNSSWIRSRRFRLGARVSQSRCIEGRVQEAISEAFLVKDHRGELYKKHHPPSLDDEVWRLEKIGKDGAFHRRLTEFGIKTVQDFLRLLEMDPDRLRNLLGSGMSNKIWEATVEHARECVLDGKLYSYCKAQGIALVFNSVFQLSGAIFDQNFCCPIDSLTVSQKAIVNKLKQLAFKNPSDIVEINETLAESFSKSLPMANVTPVHARSLLGPPVSDIPATHQVEPATHGIYDNSVSGQDFPTLQHPPPLQSNSFNMREFLEVQFGDFQTGFGAGANTNSADLIGYNNETAMLGSSPAPLLWDDVNGMLHASSARATSAHLPHLPNASARISSRNWVKLMAALKWMSISKRTAARRARIVQLDYPNLSRSMWADAGSVGW